MLGFQTQGLGTLGAPTNYRTATAGITLGGFTMASTVAVDPLRTVTAALQLGDLGLTSELGSFLPIYGPLLLGDLVLDASATVETYVSNVVNHIPNSTMVGAVVGVSGPSSWNGGAGHGSTSNGLTLQVVGVGVEDDREYVEYRLFGTALATGSMDIRPTTGASSIGAVPGQAWSFGLDVTLVAGSYAPFTGSTGLYLFARTAGGTGISGTSIPTAPTSSKQRLVASVPSTAAGTERIDPFYRLSVNSGAVVDVTLRLAAPMLSRFATEPSYVPTYNVAGGGSAPIGDFVIDSLSAVSVDAQAFIILGGGEVTNWVRQSRNCSVSPWAQSGTPVVTVSAFPAPDGGVAYDVEDNSTGSTEYRYQDVEIPMTEQSWVLSQEIRRSAATTYCSLGVALTGGEARSYRATIRLDTLNQSNFSGLVPQEKWVDIIDADWIRLSIRFVNTGGNNVARVAFYGGNGATGGSSSVLAVRTLGNMDFIQGEAPLPVVYTETTRGYTGGTGFDFSAEIDAQASISSDMLLEDFVPAISIGAQDSITASMTFEDLTVSGLVTSVMAVTGPIVLGNFTTSGALVVATKITGALSLGSLVTAGNLASAVAIQSVLALGSLTTAGELDAQASISAALPLGNFATTGLFGTVGSITAPLVLGSFVADGFVRPIRRRITFMSVRTLIPA